MGVATDRPLRSYNAVINGELRAASLAYGDSSYKNSGGCVRRMRARRGAARVQRVAAGKLHRRKPAIAALEAEPAAETQSTRWERGMRQRAA